MRKKKGLLAALAVGSFLVALGGCATAPQEDIDAAQQALEAARTSEANLYAPEALQQAEDAWTSAMTEVEAQNAKFALFRSYDRAKELMTTAKNEADEAVAEAATGKEAARQEAENLIRDTTTAIEEAKAALETAPRGKGTQAEIQAMKAEVETLGATLAEAQQAYDSGRYLDAKATAQSVKEKAEAISQDIAQAKAKRGA